MNPIDLLKSQLVGLAEGLIKHSPNILVAVVVLTATWLIAKLARKVATKVISGGVGGRSLSIAIRKVILIAVWIGGLAMTAIILFPSVKPASMLAGLGLGSVAIGFAFKDIFENFFAGMLILFRQPFQIDDFIEVEGIEGVVEDVTVRDTLVRQTDGQPVIIPNSMLFKNPVTVRTDRDYRRVTVICGVAYGEDLNEARETIQKAVDATEGVNTDRPVQIFAQSFGSSSIDFEITWWTGSKPIDIRTSRDKVITAVKKALDDAGIEIPFPYRTLTFHEPLKTESVAAE